MPKRSKAGPPYTDIPKEVYVVVIYPWGMNRNPRLRGQDDFDRIGSWAQLVLQQRGLGGGRLATIECIYTMGTRDEIIIQFKEGTDIIPLLGEHRWANIARNWQGSSRDPRSTCVFLYNWRDNGDPANHNWAENFPRHLPLDRVPTKSPYPPPSWILPPNSLPNFVIPIPRPQDPPPPPVRPSNPEKEQQQASSSHSVARAPSLALPEPVPPAHVEQPEAREQPIEQDPAEPINIFRPYEPPPQHPSHAPFLNQKQAQIDEATSRASPPPPKFVKKLDPYELEEDALNLLRAPTPDEDEKKYVKNEELRPMLYIKLEQPEIKVENDAALRSSFSPQPLPPASLGYQPGAELEAYINAHLHSVAATSSLSTAGSNTRSTHNTRVTVKREYEEDLDTPFGQRKRIKIEEF